MPPLSLPSFSHSQRHNLPIPSSLQFTILLLLASSANHFKSLLNSKLPKYQSLSQYKVFAIPASCMRLAWHTKCPQCVL
jgi:hypothetical protein